MTSVLSKYKFGVLIVCIWVSPLYIFGQDLGSSTEILRKPSTRKSSPTNKPAPKRKSSSTRTKRSTRNTAPAKEKPAVAKTDTAEKTSIGTKNDPPGDPVKSVDIRPGNSVISGEKKGNTAELIEIAIEEGNNQRNARNYDEAEAAYRRGQVIAPNDARPIYGLGNLYSDQQRWEEAERAYRAAIKIDPQSPNAYIALSFVLTQPVLGTNLIERYAEGEKLARRAIELDMGDAVAYDQLGVAMELQGKITKETQDQYQKAVNLDPTFALAYAHLGRLLRRKGLVSESNQAYINSIQFSVDVPTMILVADVMQSQQRYADSEQLLRRALGEDPKNPTALYLLGRALTTLGVFQEAEQVLKKSAEVSPRSFVSYTLLGSLFLRQRDFATAENYLEEALKVVSSNEQRRLAIEFEAVGDGYMSAGKKADAARVYRKAIALDGARPELKVKLSQADAK